MRRLRPALVLAGLVLSGAPGAAEIGGSALRFLATPPDPLPHHHRKQLIVRPDSLKSGWVENRQCHERLDPVAAMEVVFGPGRVRKLRVTRAEHIAKAWVEGESVQLQGVEPGAVLCVESETRILEYDPSLRQYTLTSGPYLRRFLDGYFPLQLTFTLEYPAERFKLLDIQPAELRARAQTPPGRVQIETLFEGRLDIVLRFAARD
jgi:hypothetical protein